MNMQIEIDWQSEVQRNSAAQRRERIVGLVRALEIVVRPGRSLVATVDFTVAALANLTRDDLPDRGVSTATRAEALEALLATAWSSVNHSWTDRLLDAVAHVVEVEQLTDMGAIRELTRRVVRAGIVTGDLDLEQPEYRRVVRWADAAGYVDGAWEAELVAHWEAHDCCVENLAEAVDRLERAIYHRSERFDVGDTGLTHLRLQAATWHTELGNHQRALAHFMLAHPALDAAGDPLEPQVIAAFRAGAETSLLLGHVDLAVEFRRQVVRRLWGMYSRSREAGAGPAELGQQRAAMVRDELDLVHAHLSHGDASAALPILDNALTLTGRCLPAGSRTHTLALAYRAEALNQLGNRQAAQEAARVVLPLARRHFGDHDPIVVSLEGLDSG